MIEKSLAETKWCPFATVSCAVKECDFSGDWIGARAYHTDGKIIAVTAINRNLDGTKNSDCLCITDKCVFWRKLDGTQGDCSKLNDNMNPRYDDDDADMAAMHCPHAQPENEVVTKPWNGDISGCTIAITSANRIAGNQMHPASKCITKECMAYTSNGVAPLVGYCMSSDKNMQRR